MVGLLSLPDELIEHLGRGIICSNKCGRFRKWCRVASTCKQLWHMQLPGTTSEWFVDLDRDIEGESEKVCSSCANPACHACATDYHAGSSRYTLGIAANSASSYINHLHIAHWRQIAAKQDGRAGSATPHCGIHDQGIPKLSRPHRLGWPSILDARQPTRHRRSLSVP